MNLHNLSDQEFDHELRRHLEDVKIPFDPQSWSKMNRKLDLTFISNNGRNGSILGLSLLSLLLAALFFLGLTSFPQNELGSGADHIVTESFSHSENSEQQSIAARDKQPVQQNAKDKQIRKESAENQQTLKKNLTERYPSVQNETSGRQNTSSGTPSALDERAHSLQGNRSVLTDTAAGTAVSNSAQIPLQTSLISSSQMAFAEIEIFLPDEIKWTDSVREALPPVVAEPKGSPWFIGLGYAPDISLVGFGETTGPGANLNVSLEYRLGSRWSIQTGLIYSMKKYKADGEDYNPPEGFWGYGATPAGADGECDVIDIPLNIRYYFKPGTRHRFFAGTGVSSYLMLTEDYYYHYDDYGYNQIDSWSVRNENRHLFGIYNISAGYQRNMGKQWYLEIEPFIKVPLSGIGFGDVDLWSTGAMFSIKYNLE